MTPDFNKLRQLIQQEIQKEKETHPFVHQYQDAEGHWHTFKTNIYDWEGAIPVVRDVRGNKVKIQWVKPGPAWQNLYTTKSVVYDPELQAWVDIGLYNKLHKQQIRQPDLTPEQIQQLNKANEGDVRNRRNDYIIRGWKDGKEIEFRAETEDEAFIRAEQLKEQGYTYQVIRPENVSWKYGSLPEFLAKHPELAKELKNRRIKDVIRENGKIKLILELRQPSEQPKKQPSEPIKGRDTGLRVAANKLKEYEKELKKLMEEKGDEGIKEFLRRHPEFKGTLEVRGLKIGSFTEALLKQKPKSIKSDFTTDLEEKAVELQLKGEQTRNPAERFVIGAELAGVGVALGVTDTLKGLVEIGKEAVHDPIKAAEDAVKGTVNWAINLPRRVVSALEGNPLEAGEVVGEILTAEAIRRVGEKIAGKLPAEKVSTPVKEAVKKASKKAEPVLEKIVPVRQTVIKGARIIEYEKATPEPHEVAFRTDTPTKMLDITNKAFRKVELITEKRWKLGKSVESLEIPEHAKTLAEVKEIVKEKTPHGSEITTVRKGLGKAEIEFHRTEPAKEIKTIEDVSSALMGEKEGRMVNVKAETIATPSERGKVLEKLHEEFKQEGVDAIPLEALKKADEIVKKGLEAQFEKEGTVQYFKKVGEEIIPKAETPKRLRIVEVKFRPDLTKEILKESNKLEKLEGKTVKPEELIPKEKEIRLTESIREVEMKPPKDEALEKMMTKEYRKELAKTIKNLHEHGGIKPEEYFKSIEKANKEWESFLRSEEGKRAIADYKKILEETKESPTKQKLELVERPKEEVAKPLEDYPVLEEKPITDMIKEALKPVKEMFERISKGAGLGVGLAEIGKNIEKANRIAENIFKINVEFKPIEMSKPFENVKVKPKTKPIEEIKPFEEIKPYIGELPSLTTDVAPTETLSPALTTKQAVKVTEELNIPPPVEFPMPIPELFFTPPKIPQQTAFDEILFGQKVVSKGVKVNPVASNPFKISMFNANKVFNKMYNVLL